MSKIGRNELCPCGSGKKYKKCCQNRSKSLPLKTKITAYEPQWIPVQDPIDRDSNHVVDLVNEGRLDEAELAAKQLLRKYPDFIDGSDRLAMVYEARSEHALAAQWYQRALDFAQHNGGFDEEMLQDYRDKITRLKKSAGF